MLTSVMLTNNSTLASIDGAEERPSSSPTENLTKKLCFPWLPAIDGFSTGEQMHDLLIITPRVLAPFAGETPYDSSHIF